MTFRFFNVPRGLVFYILLGHLSFSPNASAEEFSIYGLKHQLPLSEAEIDRPRTDYYVSVGEFHGVKKGTLLNVLRRVATQDRVSKVTFDMHVPIAQVLVIHAEETVAIARLYQWNQEPTLPVLDVGGLGIGDRVEISGMAPATLQRGESEADPLRGTASRNPASSQLPFKGKTVYLDQHQGPHLPPQR